MTHAGAGGSLEDMMLVKEARHKRTNTYECSHLYEVPSGARFRDRTEPTGLGEGQLVFNGLRASDQDDKSVWRWVVVMVACHRKCN